MGMKNSDYPFESNSEIGLAFLYKKIYLYSLKVLN